MTEHAWQWEIQYKIGSKRCGDLGQVGNQDEAEQHINTILEMLPAGVTARGHLTLLGPASADGERPVIRRVASVQRTEGGQILWAESERERTGDPDMPFFFRRCEIEPPVSCTGRLQRALMARGLAVTLNPEGVLTARNRAADPPPDSPHAWLLSSSLQQPIVCRKHPQTGALWWHWVWQGLMPDDEPDYEPFCPVEEIERAANCIAAVLLVPDCGPS
jgi:hypothetical protein